MTRARNWSVPPTQDQPARSNDAAGGRGTAVAIEAGGIVLKAWGLSTAALIVLAAFAFAAGVALQAVQP